MERIDLSATFAKHQEWEASKVDPRRFSGTEYVREEVFFPKGECAELTDWLAGISDLSVLDTYGEWVSIQFWIVGDEFPDMEAYLVGDNHVYHCEPTASMWTQILNKDFRQHMKRAEDPGFFEKIKIPGCSLRLSVQASGHRVFENTVRPFVPHRHMPQWAYTHFEIALEDADTGKGVDFMDTPLRSWATKKFGYLTLSEYFDGSNISMAPIELIQELFERLHHWEFWEFKLDYPQTTVVHRCDNHIPVKKK